MTRTHSTDVMQLFETKPCVYVCAPMVRYSKVQFRTLVRKYNCDLCFTPMILADSFCQSSKARNNEFTTNRLDAPLVVQFAANTVHDFVGASHMVAPNCDGVDLNCGCPQRWAKQMGLGTSLLEKPELICDMIRQCRNQILKPLTVSVKLRLLKNERQTVEVCRQLEKAGVSFLTVHARTPAQTSGEINVDVLKDIVSSVDCPVIGNGDLKSLDDCVRLQQATGCKGTMVANGMLTNPTLYSGSNATTKECIQDWVDICYNSTFNKDTLPDLFEIPCYIPPKPQNLTFQCFHHHLVFMLEKILTRRKRQVFNNLQTFESVLHFLKDEFDITPRLYDTEMFLKNEVNVLDYGTRNELYLSMRKDCETNIFYDYDNSEGSYFKNKVASCEVDCDLSNIFID